MRHFEVRSPQDAEDADYLICRRIAYPFEILEGSDRAICFKCAHPVWVKPYSPKKPTRVCDQCMAELEQEADARGDDVKYSARTESWGKQCINRIQAMRYWKRAKGP